MKKFITTVFILFAIGHLLFGQTPKRPAPPKPAVQQKTEEPKTLGVTFERYLSNYAVNADGTFLQTLEVQTRYDSKTAVEQFGNFEQGFNGDLQDIKVLEAYILKANGRKITVPEGSVKIQPTPQAQAAPSFSSYKVAQIKFDGLEIGDSTFYKLQIKETKSNFENHFNMMEIFPAVFGWKSIEVNVTAPPDLPLFAQAVHLEGGKLTGESGKSVWKWQRLNFKPLELEIAMYDFTRQSPRLAVTSFKNYEELGAAYWAEAAKKSVVTPEIKALADEITQNITDPQQQASAIYDWVNKNIRYLSIVLERGGWIPHDAAEILRNRYGDCKDYTTVLYVLLKAKNIESHPVIIRADYTDWFPEIAVPNYFNHAILYIPSLNLYADATSPNTRLGLIPQLINGKKAFLAGEKTGVIETAAGKPEDNQMFSEVDIFFETDGSLRANSKNIYQGRSEILFRPVFADSLIQKNSDNFVKIMLAFYGVNGTGKIKKIANPFKVGEPFEVEMEVNLEGFTVFQPKSSIRLPVAVNMLNPLELEQFVKTEKRGTNLLIGATRIRETFNLHFPEGITVEKLPAPVNFENPVGKYRNEFKTEENKIVAVREIVINKDTILPEEYSLARALIKKSVEGFNAEIEYRADPKIIRSNAKIAGKKNSAASKPKTFEELIAEGFLGSTTEKKLTARQVTQMEAKLQKNPNDTETRKQLLRHYYSRETKPTPKISKAKIGHRLWFIQNRPEIEDIEIFGYRASLYKETGDDYQILKTEWLKKVEENKENSLIRLNAVDYTRNNEPDIATKLLLEGQKIDPENYEFPFLLSQITESEGNSADNKDNPEKNNELLEQSFRFGETALILLKKERSEIRDDKRGKLLLDLVKTAFKLKKYDRARAMATELILDFGQNEHSYDFVKATHTGNIILGRIALTENDLVKAKEYLLIAIKAPLRTQGSYFNEPDMDLAKELFEKGEKETVSEYLKLCTELWYFKTDPDSNADEISALKLWLEQIKQGKTPSFDFENP